MEVKHPTLAIMSYGGLMGETASCVINELAVSPIHWNVECHPGDGAVDRQRSTVATKFLASDSDVLMMVDHDISWHKGDALYVANLAAKHQGIVGGLYSKRCLGKGWGGRFGTNDKHEYGTDELVELGYDGFIGGGFMAIHREVFNGILQHFKMPFVRSQFIPFFIPECRKHKTMGDWEYLSEDWVIANRAREAGFKTFVSMKPHLLHVGNYPFTVLGSSI